MIFSLIQLVTLVLALISSLECTSNGDLPVLGLYSSVSTHQSLPIGRLTSSKEFAQQLSSLLAGTTNLNVILVTGNLIPRKEIKESLQKSDLNDNVIYHSQVEKPLETLLEHAGKQGMQVNIERMLYLEDALLRFQQLQSGLASKASLILTAGQHNPAPEASDSTVQRAKRAAASDSSQASTAAGAAPNPNNTYVYGSQCAAFFESISFKDDSDPSKKTDLTDLVIDDTATKFDCSSNQTQTLTIGFVGNNTGILGQPIAKLTLGFKLTNNTMYYELSGVSIQLKNSATYQLVYMGTPYGMETPLSYSFVCTRTNFLLRNASANIRVSFYINELQLQPYGVSVVNQTVYNFGRINYCQGFFSSGIWMAITSSLLLALILSCGVTALMSINTMDRFDDPKGKPLNIGMEK